MTVSTSTSTSFYVGSGQISLPLTFRFFENSEVNFYRIDPATGVATLQALGVDYTLSGAGEPEVNGSPTGVISLTSALAVGTNGYAERVLPVEQSTDFVNQGRFFPEVHENAFDYVTMLIQQGLAANSGAIRVAVGDPEPARLPPAPSRANLLLGFDSNGNPVPIAPADGSASALALLLANSADPTKGVSLVGRGVVSVDSLVGLLTLPTQADKRAIVSSYHSGWAAASFGPLGGSTWTWDSTEPKANHNGFDVVSPTVPWNGSFATLDAFQAGTGETSPGGTGCWLRVHGANDIVSWGCLPAVGTDNFNALSRAIAWAYTQKRKLKANAGRFEHGSTLDLSYPELVLQGNGFRNTVFKYTGNSIAMRADNDRPNNGAFSFDIDLADFTIEGNGNAQLLLRLRIHHSRLTNINLREANTSTGVALSIEGVTIGNYKNVTCSTNTQLMTFRPLRGLIVRDDPITTARATDLTFDNLVIEGTLEDGIHLDECDFATFINGTSENNPGVGVVIADGCKGNTFIGMCFENAGFADVSDDGQFNKFLDCYGTKGLYIGPNAQHHRTEGGFWHSVFEESTADHSTVQDIWFNILVAPLGTVVLNSGTFSVRNLYNAQTGLYFVPQKPMQAPVVPASGGTISNGTGVAVDVFVYGGTTVTCTVNRGAATVGPLAGDQSFYLPAGASFLLTYAVAPTVQFLPRGSEFT